MDVFSMCTYNCPTWLVENIYILFFFKLFCGLLKITWPYYCGCISGHCTVLMICLSIFMPIRVFLHYCRSLEVRYCNSPLQFFSRIGWAAPSSLRFLMSFRISLYISAERKKACWDLHRESIDSIDQIDQFRRNFGRHFDSIGSSSSQRCYTSPLTSDFFHPSWHWSIVYRPSFVQFIFKYFMFLNVSVNGLLSKICFPFVHSSI